MKKANSFNSHRFWLLIQQNFFLNRQAVVVILLGVCAGIFVLLLGAQVLEDFKPISTDTFFMIFIFLYMVLAAVYIGSSFPGLRSNQKSYNYLLIPASTTEKFLLEVLTRLALFILIMPAIYWIIFHLEGNFIQLIQPDYEFSTISYLDFPLLHVPHGNIWMHLFNFSIGFLFLSVPIAGAAAFMKHPILKTLGYAAVGLFLHIIAFYLYGKLGVGGIAPPLVVGYFALINITMIYLAYVNFKKREA